jgi:hypothetical protein
VAVSARQRAATELRGVVELVADAVVRLRLDGLALGALLLAGLGLGPARRAS